MHCDICTPLFNPDISRLNQKRHPYTGNLNSETSGDRTIAFPHEGHVLGITLSYRSPEKRRCAHRFIEVLLRLKQCVKAVKSHRVLASFEISFMATATGITFS